MDDVIRELGADSGDELDVFASRRLHAHCSRAGYCARVKRRYRRRVRRWTAAEIERIKADAHEFDELFEVDRDKQ